MFRLPHFSLFLIAAVHLLLLSIICPVSSSRIYETNDAVVIELGNSRSQPQTRSVRSSNYGNPAAILMPYVLNPYYTGPYPQQQPNIPFWPLLKPASKNASVDVEDEPATSPQSKQQNIACGVGPASPPERSTPVVGIVGGTEATPNSWPFIVGIRSDTVRNFPGNVECGASLISPTRILSAAHCFNAMSISEMESITASFGMHRQGLKNTFNDAQQTRKVTRVVYHKDYNDKTKFFDIAVLTIDPPITYSKIISPVCLPPASTAVDQFVGKDAAVMGWGNLESKGESPNELQQVTVKVISNTECQKKYVSKYTILNQQFCASALGKDSCQGDSGGPFVMQTKGAGSPWTQVGVVSYGEGCANPKFPGVYASVSFFRNWINTYMFN